jgi:hypothetical protein
VTYVAIGCGVVLATIFAVSAVGKARSATAFKAFVDSLGDMRLVPRRWRGAVAAGVIVVEAGVVVLLVVPGGARFAFPVAAALLTLFAAAVAVTVRRGVRAACLCFGARVSRPLDRVHVVRNLVLAGVGGLGTVAVTTSSPGDVHLAGVAVAAGAAAVVAAVVLRLDDVVDLFRAPAAVSDIRPHQTLRQER